MNDVAEMELLARAWLAHIDRHSRRLREACIWAQESEHERCYEIASRLEEVLKAMEVDRAAAVADLELLTVSEQQK